MGAGACRYPCQCNLTVTRRANPRSGGFEGDLWKFSYIAHSGLRRPLRSTKTPAGRARPSARASMPNRSKRQGTDLLSSNLNRVEDQRELRCVHVEMMRSCRRTHLSSMPINNTARNGLSHSIGASYRAIKLSLCQSGVAQDRASPTDHRQRRPLAVFLSVCQLARPLRSRWGMSDRRSPS